MSRKAKRYLMLLAAIGLVAVVVGGESGTFATFNAEVANNNNVFQTGTLFLHDTTGGTTCSSESASNNANLGTGDTCNQVFNVSAAGGAAGVTYYQVALKNAGSINASALKFYTNSACASTSVGVSDGTANGIQTTVTTVNVSGLTLGIPSGTAIKFAGGPTVHTVGVTANNATSITVDTPVTVANGDTVQFFPSFTGSGGDLCSTLGFAIWDMSGASSPSTDVTPGDGVCVYTPGCAFGANTDLGHLPATAGASNATLSGGGLNAGATRYFLIGINEPDLDNSFQSQQAKVSVAWHIEQ
jgi:hypothetical protein